MGSRGPIRVASRPIRADSSSMTMVTGSNALPAATGVKPDTRCSCTGMRKNAPLSAAYSTSVTAFAAANWRERNSDSGIIGDRPRACDTTNSPSTTTPTSRQPTSQTGQPRCGPSVSAYTRNARPTAASAAPSTSRSPAACSSRVSGT
jgi:hypothetical protein